MPHALVTLYLTSFVLLCLIFEGLLFFFRRSRQKVRRYVWLRRIAHVSLGIALLLDILFTGLGNINLSNLPKEIEPSRMFAGPNQYPPTAFRAYGVVAFPNRPDQADKSRFEIICKAYVSSLVFHMDVGVPDRQQMVTVWPIQTDQMADKINKERRDSVCGDAVPNYGLLIAQNAIEAAKRQAVSLGGSGPFLIAWCPGADRFIIPDYSQGLLSARRVQVLYLDMSDVINYTQALQFFQLWHDDIQNDRELWQDGYWDQRRLVLKIRVWADKWGSKVLRAVGVDSSEQ